MTPRYLQEIEDGTLREADRAGIASRSTWVSVAVNIVLTVAQLWLGILSKSQALVADALHSLSDLVSDFVVLFANRHSHKAADAEHPYGHHRFETGASLALGLLLLGVGVGMLWSAASKLEQPANIATVHPIAMGVALTTLAAKELLFRYLLSQARRAGSSMLVANAWHARSDAASSLVVALGIAGSLAGFPILDPIAAALVGYMVARMGWKFGWAALNDLMDRGADEAEVAAIRRTLAATPGVRGVHDVKTRKMGDMLLVDAHLEVDGSLTVDAGHGIAVEARKRVLAGHAVIDVMTHLDPWMNSDESSERDGARRR